ncbi:hypothetical protein [Lacrimispora saccharolytica]|uniref:Uncharacterized protein n=1 Tax=Lacrimispora saccharolytica (strain ATCC 35040 / DSM 2544 / NRCC 2533 / WM1) TaxID=610130 RepID=D9R7J6_LACSW|nr:hypothetical protein [Lacrimispora saccharolytica]ADL03725.1 hypothetical protein Closa_1109 [[Clostridium] saccharolyticum WM1]QRV18143.1 hypothetical protein I6K70_11230 [Lacrimispora saccharolytica]
MKQLGNLAVVCARRPDVLLQILGGVVCLHVGIGPQRESITLDWVDDEKITSLVRELNFGCYQIKEEKNDD